MVSPTLRRASRAHSPSRTTFGRKNSTGMTTAASPLPGWPRAVRADRRRPLTTTSRSLMRTDMTIPARVQSANSLADNTHLPISNPPALNAAVTLAALVARPLTDGAFKIAAAMLVLSTDTHGWLDLPQIAATAGMTEGRARQFLGELTRARVIQRQKQLVYRDGKPTARNRYALVVAA